MFILHVLCLAWSICFAGTLAPFVSKASGDDSLKENRIEAVFKDIAYGRSGHKWLKNESDTKWIVRKEDNRLKRKPIFHKISRKEEPEVSGVIYQAFPQSLMREPSKILMPKIKENFTLFELSTPKPSLAQTTYKSVKISTESNVNLSKIINTSPSHGKILWKDKHCWNIRESLMKWKLNSIVCACFLLLIIYPLIILYQLHISKITHVAVWLSTFILIDVLIICFFRILQHSLRMLNFNKFIESPFMTLFFFHYSQWIFHHAVTLYIVILTIPVLRPSSFLIPTILCCASSIFLSVKILMVFGCFLFCRENCFVVHKIRISLTGFSLSEILILFVCMTTLAIFAKQRHRNWWIRLYKLSLRKEDKTHLLYSQLKTSLRIGLLAVGCILIYSFITAAYDFSVIKHSFLDKMKENGHDEFAFRCVEAIICLTFMIAIINLFVHEIHTVIKKDSVCKKLMNVIKGKRSKNYNYRQKEDIRLPLSIFTVNKGSKTPDSLTSDFQLVWNNDRSNQTYNGAKSSQCSRKSSYKNPFKHSYSSGMLETVGKIETPGDRTTCFQYDFSFAQEPNEAIYDNVPIPSPVMKPKKKKKSRPKSLIEEKAKLDSYGVRAPYVSAYSHGNFMDLDDLSILLGGRSSIVEQTFNLTTERQKNEMKKFSTEELDKHKDQTPIIQNKKLLASKSVELF